MDAGGWPSAHPNEMASSVSTVSYFRSLPLVLLEKRIRKTPRAAGLVRLVGE
jgi:hypothetical protein